MDENTKKVMFSSNKQDWTTPQNLFNALNKDYNFTLDAAASDENHKCQKYFTEKDDALKQDWSGNRVFVNPPYSRGIGKWVDKAIEESKKKNTIIVMLIPARTETKHALKCFKNATCIYFIQGRLKFGGTKNSAPFPSMLVIFDKGADYYYEINRKMASIYLCDKEFKPIE